MSDILSEYLSYSADNGNLKWIKSPCNSVKIGSVAGVTKAEGYIRVTFKGELYYAHRLAWFLFYGKWPSGDIDHINRDKSDNRISNLRDVSHKDNCRNQKLRATSTTGFNGVSLSGGKWEAKVCVDGKTIHLGKFDSVSDAVKARAEADVKYGFHFNHGGLS